MIPLPAPPSTFSVDSEDQVVHSSSTVSIPTIPSLASNNSFVSLESRSGRSASITQSTSSTQREPRTEEKNIGRTRFEHVQKQSVAEMKEIHSLRVEMNAQRAKYDDLAHKLESLIERQDRERVEMCRRVDILEEEAKDMEAEIKRLTSGPTKGGLLETPGSTMDDIDDFLMTPDAGSPSSPLEYARRLLTTAPKEKMLRRSNTMPDGFDESDKTESRPGKKVSNRSSSAWLLATAGLLPKFAGGSGAKMTSPGRGLGLDFALPDSPMIREGMSVSASAGRESNSSSVAALSTAGTSKSPAREVSPSVTRPRGARGRGGREEKGTTPNMEEILARLRSFESHSPAFR